MAIGIFDVYAEPDIVPALVLANLMSDRLWNMGRTASTDMSLTGRLSEYQRMINKYFTHLSPAQVADMCGTLDLDAEARRLPDGTVDSAVANIVSTLTWRAERGTVSNIDSTLELIRERKFPRFTYGAIDDLHQRLVSSGKKASRAVGLSSCLDEAALFAALVMTGPVDDLDGIVIVGSASHYTVFGWSGEPASPNFDAWWFYGKNTLLTMDDYHQVVSEAYRGDALLACADRLPGMDTFIAREGSWRLGSATSSLGEERRNSLTLALNAFFQFPVLHNDASPGSTLERIETVASSAAEELFVSCLNQRDAASVRHLVAAAASSGGDGERLATAALHLYSPAAGESRD